ncbi:MAG: hypothetical protein M3539_12440 [Acidobacteriota bacterium]|nr:hypothetical protein [Acidobacteriota bacterium]
MYCSTCGVAVAQGLSYCNYCGAKLSGASDSGHESPEVRPELLVSAMAGVFILGMAIITVLIGVMKSVLDLPADRILAFALVPLLILLLLEGVFLRLLFRRKRRTEEPGEAVRLKGSATKELDATHARSLPEPMASVTEHTTRAFAPIHTERRPE